ncbi:hypothetical protein Zm00014a_010834 [Zea mays]|uniref:Uncharacterized protein n=1 Tax=Zea mays TaxID=4577 RepID=A0A3L6G3R9_MAIZE|nr:hypothetical protein Zm00014a_010834 [Zea mays]
MDDCAGSAPLCCPCPRRPAPDPLLPGVTPTADPNSPAVLRPCTKAPATRATRAPTPSSTRALRAPSSSSSIAGRRRHSRGTDSDRHFVVKLSPFATPCSADLDANYNFSLAPVQDLLSPWDQDCHFVNDKPSSAVEFVQQKLGGPSISDYEKLKAEKLDLQLKYDKLLETHKETCRHVCDVTVLALYTALSIYTAHLMFNSIWKR